LSHRCLVKKQNIQALFLLSRPAAIVIVYTRANTMSANTRLPCHGKHDLPAWSILQKECKYQSRVANITFLRRSRLLQQQCPLICRRRHLRCHVPLVLPGNKPIVTAKKAKLSVGGGCGGNSSDGKKK
jgi:hypothetical protein